MSTDPPEARCGAVDAAEPRHASVPGSPRGAAETADLPADYYRGVSRGGALAAVVLAAAGVGAVAAAGFVLAGSSGASTAGRMPAEPPEAARRAPVPALEGADALTGKPLSLADFAGKPVVLVVWSSWCSGCPEQAAALRRFAQHAGVAVLGIDTQDTEAAARRVYERWGWSFPSLMDPDGAMVAQLGLDALPTTIFLDSRHRIAARTAGPVNLHRLTAGVASAAGSR